MTNDSVSGIFYGYIIGHAGTEVSTLCRDVLLMSHNTSGASAAGDSWKHVRASEYVYNASFFTDDPNINELRVLKNKLLRRLQKQILLTPLFVNFIVVSIP